MYPVLFEIGGFEVGSFGVMLAIAFLVGTWIASVQMREVDLDPDHASTLLLYAMFGGLAGSKLYFAIDVSLREAESFLSLLLRREGFTFYGGLVGGAAAVIAGSRIHGIPVMLLSRCAATPMAVGQGIGRIGCLLVGDDYGRASDLPWAMAFPKGSPPTLETVHPTQIYEMSWLFLVAALLFRRRRSSPFLFGEYMALNGAGRFVIEIWRTNEPVGGLTQPQWIAIALIALGGGLWLRFRQKTRAAPA